MSKSPWHNIPINAPDRPRRHDEAPVVSDSELERRLRSLEASAEEDPDPSKDELASRQARFPRRAKRPRPAGGDVTKTTPAASTQEPLGSPP